MLNMYSGGARGICSMVLSSRGGRRSMCGARAADVHARGEKGGGYFSGSQRAEGTSQALAARRNTPRPIPRPYIC